MSGVDQIKRRGRPILTALLILALLPIGAVAIHRIVPAGPDLFYAVATSGPDYLNHHKVHLLRYRRTSTIPTEPIDRLFANGFQ